MGDKVRIALKCVLVAIVAIGAIILIVIWYGNYREQNLKENIHSEMWDIFAEENMNITDEQIVYVDSERDYSNDGLSMLYFLEYNDMNYRYYFQSISEDLVDTSEILLEVPREDSKSKIAKVYKIKDTPVDYMLAAEMDGTYYQYSRSVVEHSNLKEYIDIRGSKEKLDIEYLEVILMEGEEEGAKYIYGDEVSEWVWATLLNGEHKFIDWIPCQCVGGGEYMDYPEKNVRFNIHIRNNASNAVYKVYILPNGNVAVCDGLVEAQESEYMLTASELLDALQTLVKDYKAYSVE